MSDTETRENGPGTSLETKPKAGLRGLVRLLDELVTIPGTGIKIGLDPIIGLILPGVGDWLTGAGGAALLLQALRAGVPTMILAQMLFNIAIDSVVGMVPVLGDAFDVFFRANSRNLALIEKYGGGEREPRLLDYGLLVIGVLLLIVSALAPIWLLPILWLSLQAMMGTPQ